MARRAVQNTRCEILTKIAHYALGPAKGGVEMNSKYASDYKKELQVKVLDFVKGEVVCKTCEKKFRAPPSTHRKYCSLKCYYKDPNYQNSMKGKKRPDLSAYNRKHKSEAMKGDKNPNKRPEVVAKRKRTIAGRTKEIYGKPGPLNGRWLGGISKAPYSFKFNKELKLAIKMRDGFKCKVCGVRAEDLVVHHIDYDKQNHSLENLITLCRNCHSKTNSRRQTWIEYFSRERNVEKEFITWEQIDAECSKIAEFLSTKQVDGIVPIPRGGVIPAVIIANKLDKKIKKEVTSEKDVVVDEIVDFGVVFKHYKKQHPKNLFVCLHINKKNFKLEVKPDFYVREVEKFTRYPWEVDYRK